MIGAPFPREKRSIPYECKMGNLLSSFRTNFSSLPKERSPFPSLSYLQSALTFFRDGFGRPGLRQASTGPASAVPLQRAIFSDILGAFFMVMQRSFFAETVAGLTRRSCPAMMPVLLAEFFPLPSPFSPLQSPHSFRSAIKDSRLLRCGPSSAPIPHLTQLPVSASLFFLFYDALFLPSFSSRALSFQCKVFALCR